jgi:hypothetical protein
MNHGSKQRTHLLVIARASRQTYERKKLYRKRDAGWLNNRNIGSDDGLLAAVMPGGLAAHVAAVIRHLLAAGHLFRRHRRIRLHACHDRHSCHEQQQKNSHELGDNSHCKKSTPRRRLEQIGGDYCRGRSSSTTSERPCTRSRTTSRPSGEMSKS